MKKILQAACILAVAFASVFAVRLKQPKAAKPNVIIILADQWRAEAVGYAGNKDVKTPHIDKLASQSVNFKTAVSTMPVCTPYRASLLTGQYPLKHGLFYNDKPLANEALTMAEIFKENGYRTGYIGKWHVNGHKNGEGPFSARDKPVPRERRQGFDYWKAREVTHDYNNSFYFDENDKKVYWEGYDAFPQTDSAIGFIKQSGKNPFLLVLSWGPPHNPYETAPEKYQKMYDPAKLRVRPNVPAEMQDSARKVLAQYYAHCTALDDMTGKLLDALEKQGIAENTIVVFTSDHGDMLLTRGVFRKQRPWDESALVPMLIRYPEKLGKKGITISKPLGTPDILPTLLGLSGIKIPASVQGTDVSAGILKPEKYPLDAALITLPVPFHEYNFSNGGREYRGVRTERYTYTRRLNGPWLLYDNQTDPYQQNNLIGKPEYKKIQSELEAKLTKMLKDIDDDFQPADVYMKRWNYNYDHKDSLRPASYYEELKTR
ncbi:sulfatase [Dyadobacter sp. 676]|uniref:Sulfatase n=1 Tax=Dyadobacter sp. 676 TaxID=3088362 RepID=A0AAU8FHW1_9BACT